jgi:enoyl-[acyl-carrier-protein] reductase (NADH)
VWVGTAQAKSVDSERDELAAVVSLGMLGLHKVLAVEAGSSAVTANAVLRGGNASDDDVASTVAFLCSEGAAYLSGITITVDGGAGSAVF